ASTSPALVPVVPLVSSSLISFW
ncbi:hypothetical protein A2U01_0091572, partial [Trifolium medium]|nr:hypothetical protein [Trifolium medium]